MDSSTRRTRTTQTDVSLDSAEVEAMLENAVRARLDLPEKASVRFDWNRQSQAVDMTFTHTEELDPF